MYIESLEVENFRCFEKARVLFEYDGRHGASKAPRLPNVNLILGDNGTGKSAILTAITLGVLGIVIQGSGFRPYLLVRRTAQDDGDPSRQQQKANVKAKIGLHPQDAPEIPMTWEPKTIRTAIGRASIVHLADTETIRPSLTLDYGGAKPLFEDDSPAFFLAAYGASRRVAETFDPAAREKSRSPRYQRVAGLFEEAVTLTPVSAWWNEFRQKGRTKEGLGLLNALLPSDV